MPGFANDASGNSIMWSDNVDFSGAVIPSRAITTDGQLLIGSTAAPNIKVGTLTSTGGTIAVTAGSGTINLETTGVSTVLPAFRVYSSANQTNVTGDGTAYTLNWDTVQFDQTSSWDIANSRYQVPTTGIYLFSLELELLGVTANHTIESAYIFNFSKPEYSFISGLSPAACQFQGGGVRINGQAIMSCTAGDLILTVLQVYFVDKTITVSQNGVADQRSWFSGYLIC